MRKKDQQARSEAGRALSRERWSRTTREERASIMDAVRASRVVREHCPCGLMTIERAEKRNHRCEAPVKRGKR